MTVPDRRQFIRLNAAALAGAAFAPSVAVAGPSPAASRVASMQRGASPGFYRFAVGDVEVTVLRDGHFHFPIQILEEEVEPLEFMAPNAQPAERAEFFRSRRVPTDSVPLQVSPVAIQAESDDAKDRMFIAAWVGSPLAAAVASGYGRAGRFAE